MSARLYLASASPRRKDLLQQIGVVPDQIIVANIEETPLKGELVDKMTQRLAILKAEEVAKQIEDGYVIAADTAIEIGRKTLGKAENEEDVARMIERLSGRKHRVYTSVVVALVRDHKIIKSAIKTSKTTITLKRLSKSDLDSYIKSGHGIGREGGFNIQGMVECFVKSINGSYSGIVGLPLYETNNLLISLGYKKNTLS